MRLKWDEAGKHFYETGVKQCVLFVQDSDGEYPLGVAWSGVTGITESPSGAEANKQYADNEVYLNVRAVEEFGGTIEAFQYPDEFGVCNGEDTLTTGVVIGGQGRKAFGLAYLTQLGNDTDGNNYGEKLHLIYGATCSPSEMSFETINDSVEAPTMSWEFECVPVEVTGKNKVARLTINSKATGMTEGKWKAICDAVFGTDGAGSVEGTDPYLPLPNEVKSIIDNAT